MDHRNSLQFPDDIEISGNGKKLIMAFLTDQYVIFLVFYHLICFSNSYVKVLKATIFYTCTCSVFLVNTDLVEME